MNLVAKISSWGNQHHPKWVDLLRIALGIILIWKGIAFALNLEAFSVLMRQTNIGIATSISFLAHLIIGLHLIGGLFILLGSHTRMFSLLNLPIVFIAVFFVNSNPAIFRPYAELWLSILVLLWLCVFTVLGNGKISVESSNESVEDNPLGR